MYQQQLENMKSMMTMIKEELEEGSVKRANAGIQVTQILIGNQMISMLNYIHQH